MLVSDVIQCDQCARYGKPMTPGWLGVDGVDRARLDFCSERCLVMWFAKREPAPNPHDPPAPPVEEPAPEPAPVPVMLHTRAFYVRAGWDGMTGADDIRRDFDAWRVGPRVDGGGVPAALNGWGLIARVLPPDEARVRQTLGWALDLPVLDVDEPVTVLVEVGQ